VPIAAWLFLAYRATVAKQGSSSSAVKHEIWFRGKRPSSDILTKMEARAQARAEALQPGHLTNDLACPGLAPPLKQEAQLLLC